MLERIIKAQLISFMLSTDLIAENHYGFLAKRSVASCQTHFLNILATAHNDGLSAIIIYLDIRKAFDQVPHVLLLNKLRRAGISGSLLCWLQSYLSGRTQMTCVSGHYSSPLPITSGVVQGSVLGPILFLLYINDILGCIKDGVAFLFADDIKIVYCFPPIDTHTVLANVQLELDRLSIWSANAKLHFATNKCHVLPYRCCIAANSLLLSGSYLPTADATSDLGLKYSCTLNFSKQTLCQTAKARRLCFLISRSFHTSSVKLSLFMQRVRPLLEYNHYTASYLSKACRLAIENIQRRFTKKLLPPNSPYSYLERCQIFKLDPLWLRRLKLNLIFLHRLVYCHTYTAISNLNFTFASDYNLRSCEFSLDYARSRTSSHQCSFLSFYSRL